MRFIKETIGLILIIIFIITIEIITTKFTNNSLGLINSEIETIQKIDDKKDLKERIEKLFKIWEEEAKKLSCYIEHDELEEISNNIKSLVYDSKNNDEEAMEKNLNQIKFKMEKIKNNQKLNIENIF